MSSFVFIAWGGQCEDNLLCGCLHCIVMGWFMNEIWGQLSCLSAVPEFVSRWSHFLTEVSSFFYCMGWGMEDSAYFLCSCVHCMLKGSCMKELCGQLSCLSVVLEFVSRWPHFFTRYPVFFLLHGMTNVNQNNSIPNDPNTKILVVFRTIHKHHNKYY